MRLTIKYPHSPTLVHISPSYVTGVITKVSDNIEIPVTGIADAAVKLGLLSPQEIPKEASPDIVNVPP